MWGEGASDLWGRLEQEEDAREDELIAAIRERLKATGHTDTEDVVTAGSLRSLGTAA